MSKIINGQAAKAIVALIGAVSTLLSHYANSWWQPSVVAALTLIGVYLVPNASPPPVVPPAPPKAETPPPAAV